jgi:glycosyltransferase involved in cell wall biosynthesis
VRELRVGYLCAALRIKRDETSETSGARAHLVGLTEAFQAEGHHLDLFLAGDSAPSFLTQPGAESVMRKGRLRQLVVDTVRLALRFVFRWVACTQVPRDVDVVYERQAMFQALGKPWQRRGIPWVVESNGPYWHEGDVERGTLSMVGLAKRLETAAYQRADLVVAVSPVLKDILVRECRLDADKVLVLPNAVSSGRFSALPEPHRLHSAFTVGFIGYHIDWAGLDDLLDALATVRATGRDVRATFLGEGPARADLEAQADRLGLADVVRFLGQKAWAEVPSYVAGFDVGFSGQRSMSIGGMYHSPLKIYEYQAMQVPILASDYPDARRLVANADSGLLFDADRPGALAEALADAFDRRGELPAMGERGRAEVLAHHTWEARVRTLVDELDSRGLLRRR